MPYDPEQLQALFWRTKGLLGIDALRKIRSTKRRNDAFTLALTKAIEDAGGPAGVSDARIHDAFRIAMETGAP